MRIRNRCSRTPSELLCLVVVILGIGGTACEDGSIEASGVTDVDAILADLPELPETADWVEHGLLFREGEPGTWDRHLWGGKALAVIKREEHYDLYYQGSSDFSSRLQSVVGRSVGLALIGPDLETIHKYPENPILTWHPTCANNDCEEGAVSFSTLSLDDGSVVAYYGANTEETSQTVNSDARVAYSSDGRSFTDGGIVISHAESSTWGSGDEISPVSAIHESGVTYVYYVPNGSPQAHQLGVAWGRSFDELSRTDAARANGAPVPAWGSMSSVRIDARRYYLFVNDVTNRVLRAYLVDLSDPTTLVGPLQEYRFEEFSQGIVHADSTLQDWLLFYRQDPVFEYRLKSYRADGAVSNSQEVHDGYSGD